MIYMILGDTNAGKDTILNGVASDRHLRLKKLVQYTTRPKREYEKDGKIISFVKIGILNTSSSIINLYIHTM